MIRSDYLLSAAFSVLALPSPAAAQAITPAAAEKDAPAAPAATPATPTFAVTGGATLTTDYRFRGLSQTNKTVAVQGTATITHSSGFYASFWGSTIDDYIANGSDAELDLIAGYKHAFKGGTSLDSGVLYYVYPGNNGADTDFFEPYVNLTQTIGPFSGKLGGNFAWKQRGLALADGKHGGAYGYVELAAAVPKTGVTITGHLGRSFQRNYITFGERYTDWSLTGAYTLKQVTLSVAYVDTDKNLFSYPTGGGINRNVAKGGVIGAIAFSF